MSIGIEAAAAGLSEVSNGTAGSRLRNGWSKVFVCQDFIAV